MTGTTRIVLNRMEYVLTEDNYDEWYEDFILELQGAGLSEYVEKNIDDIVKEVEKKYTTKDKKGNDILSEEGENKIKEHKMNNFKVLSFLRKSVDAKIKSFIRSKEEEKNSAYLILKVLKKKYHEEEFNEIPKLYRRLENMRAESDKETLEYIEEFLEITQKLGKLNNKLSNREKLNYLFKGLPEKQLNFLEIRYSISEDVDEILEDMKKQIRNRRIFIPGKNKEKEEEISQISKGKNKNKNKDKGNNYESCDEDDICEKFNNKRSINNKKKRCYLCDSENHLVYNCPFNPKNPHNNIKHIAEQFQKLNISVDEINDIELCYDSDSDSDSSIVKIKEINLIETENSIMETNLIEPENSIKEINLCEISTTSEEEKEDNNDNQYLEFKTIDDIRKFNYDTNYCNNSSENNKFKNNNTPNKTENTNIFQKENNINYDLNNYFINGIYNSNEYNNGNYKNLGINSNIHNNEIESMNKNNISNNYQNYENENPVTIDKYIIESFQDKINKTNCKLNKLLKCLSEIEEKNNNIQKIIKEYLQIMRFDNTYYENYKKYMKTINQYNNILNVNNYNPGNEIEKSVNKNSLGKKTGENYKYMKKNMFSEKKYIVNIKTCI